MASKTRAQIKNDIANYFADNTNGEIGPDDIRAVLNIMVDSDYNLSDDDADDISNIVSKITNNPSVSANTSARHSHSAGAAIADNLFTDQMVTDNSSGNVSTTVEATSDTKTNDALASVLARLNAHDDAIKDLSLKFNTVLDRLQSYGVIS